MTRRGPPEEGDDGVLYEGDFLLTADEQRALAPFIQRALTEVDVHESVSVFRFSLSDTSAKPNKGWWVCVCVSVHAGMNGWMWMDGWKDGCMPVYT